MPNQSTGLDRVFHALQDPTRRAVLRRLGRGALPATELAAPFDMAFPSFLQHLDVLEQSGLVRSKKAGRVRTYRISPRGFEGVEGFLAEQRSVWERRLDQLDRHLETLGRAAAAWKGRER